MQTLQKLSQREAKITRRLKAPAEIELIQLHLAFRPPVLNHPLRLIERHRSPSNSENESANSWNQIFRCVTHLTDGLLLPRSLARNTFFLFLSVHAIIYFASPRGRKNPPPRRRRNRRRCQCEKLAGNYFVGCIFDGSSPLADQSRRGTDVDFRTWINVLVREEIQQARRANGNNDVR